MTNLEAKQEAIKAAYGEHWNKFQAFTDKNGWLLELNTSIHHGVNEDCRTLKKFISESNLDFEEINNRLRLKSLSGIEDNLGWTRIEPDGSNLPERSASKLWKVYMLNGSIYDLNSNGLRHYFKRQECTHYKPIIEDKPPIF